MKTFSQKPAEVEKNWILIDATDAVPGRLASFVANRLRGKHKPTFTPHVDDGDNVVIVNADKVSFTGNKFNDKKYYWHTGYPGGIKERTAKALLEGRYPERVMQKAVERMMPGGPLSRRQMKNLYVYAGPEHKHEAQKPQSIDLAALNSKTQGPRNMAEINSLEELGAAVNQAATETVAADAVAANPSLAGNPPAPVHERKVDEHGRAYATGKRKDAVARVWLKPGSGRIIIEGAVKKRDVQKKNRKEGTKATKERDFTEYFARPVLQMVVKQPLVATGRETQFDIVATVSGGGLSGQAGALRHGISKALTYYEPELRGTLKSGGFLTRDSRVVERKKYGRAKARRSFQFSKR